MKNLLNNISQEEKNTILEMHSGKQIMSEQMLQSIKNLASGQGTTVPQTKPTVNKTVTPKIELDCNKKVIVKSQLPKLSKDANLAIINHFCQGTSPSPTPPAAPQPAQNPQPGPNLSRQQNPQPGPNLSRQQNQIPRI